MAETPMGLSGRIARQFLTTQITPLLALVGLLLGAFAIAITPREEEPQINVTFANIFVPFPGASAKEVEELLATPGEQVLSEIKGIEHVFSTSRAGLVVFTVQFKVGEDRTSALVRLYNKIVSNQDWLPQGLGVGEPLIKPKGIDDVPMITATLWTRDATRGNRDLLAVAHALEAELKRVPGTRDIYTIGGPPRVIQVALDPARLAGYGIAVNDLRNALAGANFSVDTTSVTVADHEILIKAGELISSVDEVAALVVGVFEGRPVFLEDVATVHEGTDDPNAYVRFGTGPASELFGIPADVGTQPAVTLVVAKKEGENAVKVAKRIIDRIEQLEGLFIPEGIEVTITRDYGATADYKASKLIQKLSFATLSVVLLVLFAMGWREAIVVGFAIIAPLLFLSPLLLFTKQLKRTKKRALAQFREKAMRNARKLEQEWLATPYDSQRDEVARSELNQLNLLTTFHDRITAMRVVPFDLRSAGQLIGSAIGPMIPLLPYFIEVPEPLQVMLEALTKWLPH